MKKISIFLLITVCVFMLVGCSSKSSENISSEKTGAYRIETQFFSIEKTDEFCVINYYDEMNWWRYSASVKMDIEMFEKYYEIFETLDKGYWKRNKF